MAATPERVDPIDGLGTYRNWGERGQNIHVDHVYVALVNAAKTMEDRLKTSLENYEAHPDVQANLQQLQYDLQSWNVFSRRSWEGFLLRWEKVFIGAKKNPFKIAA